mgnify:CR=1 FL=1
MSSPNIRAKTFWKPNSENESRRLNSSSSGWKLAGTSVLSKRVRTPRAFEDAENESFRSPKQPRTVFATTATTEATPLSSLTGSVTNESTSSSSKKPQPSRVLLECHKLKAQMERNTTCQKCQSNVIVAFPTTGIASGSRIACASEMCDWIDCESPAGATMPAIADHRHRDVDCAANVLCVLSFMACGDGGAEAGKLLGLLGLPNSTTFAKRSFGLTERFLGPELLRLADEVVCEKNLTDEVRLVLGDKRDNDNVLLFDLWKEKKLPQNLWPRVTASGDMGWQGKGSGNSHDSQSGDAVYVGSLTRKPTAWHVLGEGCSTCNGWQRSKRSKGGEPCPPHACRKSWSGSSGAMEPVALLEMFKELFNKHQAIVHQIVSDDDSSVRAKLKWSNADWMTNANSLEPPCVCAKDTGKRSASPDCGRLPPDMPEPAFVADPNHRKKAWSNCLCATEKKNCLLYTSPSPRD